MEIPLEVKAEIERRTATLSEFDQLIIGLLNRRQGELHLLRMARRQYGLPLQDTTQEQRPLRFIRTMNPGPMTCGMLERIYAAIIREGGGDG